MGRSDLDREIRQLETHLAGATGGRAVDELARIRRDLAGGGVRKPAIELPNLRLGFACKQRWEDMAGDDRVRACGGCDRPVFNLSAMTREEAERLLAVRGLTPCVRFYRRPDGTVMTSDCPDGSRPERRRLAVVASSLAAGTALAAAPAARAEPAPASAVTTAETATDEPAADEAAADPEPPPDERVEPIVIDHVFMGLPASREFEMGVIEVAPAERPRIEWSVWGRLGFGVAQQHPGVLARGITTPAVESSPIWEGALGAEVTVGIARAGNLRLGAWSELRTSSGPVAGGELVIEGLPPHPLVSRIDGAGSIVLRAGGNAHVFTGALGVGYVGSWPRSEPWIRWVRHVVGVRFVGSVNRSLDDPADWSATLGIEIEPIGALHAVIDDVKGR